jgi:hypothetical protein
VCKCDGFNFVVRELVHRTTDFNPFGIEFQ